MMRHVIKNAEGRYYSFTGWTPSADAALDFKNEGDAKTYALKEKLFGATVEKMAPRQPSREPQPDVGRSIFGYGHNSDD
jgi:hypothetical protein